MRSLVLLVSLSVALATVGFARADQPAVSDATKEATAYTCPMHPKVQSAKPGICPLCKMKLQARKTTTPKSGPAPGAAMPDRDTAAMDHSSTESVGTDAMGTGNDAMSCPMCKNMPGMSTGGGSADGVAKNAKPTAPAGYQRPTGRRCGKC
jgi:hypothetical protein